MTRRVVMAAIAACASVSLAPGRAEERGTAAPVPVLVELFTSEGCSSCPPADRLLMDLIATEPVAGARIIALSEHVDYWDRLGWKDPFSNPVFAGRQSAYAAAVRSADVYTPQLVVDGRDAFVGSDRARALEAIRIAATREKPPLRLAWVSQARTQLDVTVPASRALAHARVVLAVTEDGLTTHVLGGENQGRELTHTAVVRRFTELGTTDARGAFHAVAPIVIDPAWKPHALGIVVLVQTRAGEVVAVETIGVSSKSE